MKTKILILFGLINLIISQADAYTITMQGGGRDSRFSYVNCTKYALTCRGNGSLVCPVVWEIAVIKGVRHPVSEIVDYVSKLIRNGEKSGKTMYQDAIPTKWESIEDGYQIDIDVDEVLTEDHD